MGADLGCFACRSLRSRKDVVDGCRDAWRPAALPGCYHPGCEWGLF
jgi:hypothetical protein